MKYLIFFLMFVWIANGTTIIGCYNSRTAEIREPLNSWVYWCYMWDWWKNIMLPPESHLEVWRRYWTERQVINRLVIVNFESSFDENRSNPFAHWYVQTLRKRDISKDIDSQLRWMKNREQWILSDNVCGRYWSQYNSIDWFERWERGVLACMYRYHYHNEKGIWYAKRGMKVRDFYISYFEKNGKY